jgi:diacylglycerol kinase (ATP)
MTSPLLIFVNPGSGGGLAGDFQRRFAGDRTIHFVELPRGAATWSSDHSSVLTDPSLRCVACGGDGTSNWVVSLLSAHFGLPDRDGRPPVAMLPFGSGNDMSRSQGWGRRLAAGDLRQMAAALALVRSSSAIRNVDVWTIEMARSDTGEVIRRVMVNYFSSNWYL